MQKTMTCWAHVRATTEDDMNALDCHIQIIPPVYCIEAIEGEITTPNHGKKWELTGHDRTKREIKAC